MTLEVLSLLCLGIVSIRTAAAEVNNWLVVASLANIKFPGMCCAATWMKTFAASSYPIHSLDVSFHYHAKQLFTWILPIHPSCIHLP